MRKLELFMMPEEILYTANKIIFPYTKMTATKLETLKEQIHAVEALEKQIHSKKIQLPKEWFWHGEFVKAIRNLYSSILQEIEEVEEYQREKVMNDYNLRNLTDSLEKLLDRLNQDLRKIEGENFFYTPEQAEEINSLLSSVDYYLIQLMKKFRVLERKYSYDSLMQKKKILMELGLNVFKHPEITAMILGDWSIVEEIEEIFGKDFQKHDKLHYVWRLLPLFNNLIFVKLPASEVQALRARITGKSSQSPEEMYADPDFLINLREFNQELRKLEGAQYGRNSRTFKHVILLLTMIVSDATVGEHLGRTVAGTYIPSLHQMIRNRQDLEIIYTNANNIHKDYPHSVCYLIGGVLPHFSELFYGYQGELLTAFHNALKKGKSESAGYILGHNILYFKDYMKTPQDVEEISVALIKTYEIWNKKKEEHQTVQSIEIYYVFGELTKERLVDTRNREDIDFMFILMQETNSLWLLKLLLSNKAVVEKDQKFFIRLLRKTNYPELFFKILLEITSGSISNLRKYPSIIESVADNINRYKTNIAPYESNMLKISHFLHSIQEVEYLLKILGDYDSNLLHNLFEILEFLKPYQITSFQLFLEYGGTEVLESIRRYKEIKVNHDILQFCAVIIQARNPRDYRELLEIFNKAFSFINREIQDNRVKMKQLRHASAISKSIYRHFGDFLLYVMEQAPKHFMSVLFAIGRLVQINAEITREILQIAKISRSFRLFVSENKVEGINLQDIENTYLFLVQQLSKKPKIEKLRKNLKKFGTQHSKTAFNQINTMIMNLSIEYFLSAARVKIKDAFEEYSGVSLPSELADDDDAVNALLIAKACTLGTNQNIAKTFIREVCLKDTVPFKQYPDAYPYNQPENIEFIRSMEARGINLNCWINGFKREYKPIFTDVLQNIEKIIAQHVAEVIEEYKELEMEVAGADIFEKFAEIKDHENQSIVGDIKHHLQQIKSLRGQNIYILEIKKVTIYVETNPLKVLQMGNVVSGSCLNLGGSNSWTTITNAVDVNKRILYAENERGIVLARRMITMTDEGKIIQYGVYNNAAQLDIDTLFQQFTLELAENCNTKIANSGNTSTLVGEQWYAGTMIQPFTIS